MRACFTLSTVRCTQQNIVYKAHLKMLKQCKRAGSHKFHSAGSLQVQGNKVSNATDTQYGVGTLGYHTAIPLLANRKMECENFRSKL